VTQGGKINLSNTVLGAVSGSRLFILIRRKGNGRGELGGAEVAVGKNAINGGGGVGHGVRGKK